MCKSLIVDNCGHTNSPSFVRFYRSTRCLLQCKLKVVCLMQRGVKEDNFVIKIFLAFASKPKLSAWLFTIITDWGILCFFKPNHWDVKEQRASFSRLFYFHQTHSPGTSVYIKLLDQSCLNMLKHANHRKNQWASLSRFFLLVILKLYLSEYKIPIYRQATSSLLKNKIQHLQKWVWRCHILVS